jgi:RNA polymerase sigma-70 factor (ECF subfamily)
MRTDRLLDTEPELVRKLKTGDPSAYHRLVDRFADRLFGLARKLVRNSADAEDVVQETFAGAYRAMGRFEQRSSLWTWLVSILVRQASKRRESAGRMKIVPAEVAGESPAPSRSGSTATSVDARIDVSAALLKLSDEHREIVVLRELQQMSYDEISEALDLPIGTVESRLFRARAELRKCLKDWAVESVQ